MTKVIALDKGFYKQIRERGEVFHIPFTDAEIEKTSWLAHAGTEVPEERVIPQSRSASMADVIKGVAEEDDEPAPDTMSEMTAQSQNYQKAHRRAHGLEPAAEEPKPKPKRRGRPKGSKNKPKPAPVAEVTP